MSQFLDFLDQVGKYVRTSSAPNQPPVAVSGTVVIAPNQPPVNVSGSVVAVISGGSIKTDRTTYTEATSTFTPVGGVFNDTLGADLTEDQSGASRMTARRGQHVNLRDSSGTEIGTTLAPLAVSGTVSVNPHAVFQTAGPWAVSGSIGGFTTIVSSTLTRPGNTTAYAAGDEVTDNGTAIITLTNLARFSGGTGVIQGICATFSDNWATKPVAEVWLFDTTSTPQTDNTAFAPADGVVDTAFAVIPLSVTYVADATANTGNMVMDTGSISIPFQTVGSANVFLRLVVRNAAQAGANSGTIKFRVRALCD